jgi:outer membrane biosynthesis protein TonB
MRVLRAGAAAQAGAVPRVAFPGLPAPAPAGRRGRVAAWGAAILLHAGVLTALFVLVAPPEEPEKPIPVQILHEPPPRPKVERVVEKTPSPAPTPAPVPAPKPAPAPKALAERRSVDFNPSAQAIAPQVVNPTVVARAAPVVAAEKLRVDALASVAAPRDIGRSPLSVDSVQALPSPVAATPSKLDLGSAGAPALRGPIQNRAPAGPSVGPRQVVTSGDSVGLGPVAVGNGSSVREGALSTRDVQGTPDGPRLANVNTRVGQGNLRGSGGEGTVIGGGGADCNERPEVSAYLEQVKDRTIARWAPPQGSAPGRYRVRLRFQLDVGGSATRVELVHSDDARVGASAAAALRAATPFAPMSDRVRCLANTGIVADFTLNTGTSTAVAN